jgi:hypothetical protein
MVGKSLLCARRNLSCNEDDGYSCCYCSDILRNQWKFSAVGLLDVVSMWVTLVFMILRLLALELWMLQKPVIPGSPFLRLSFKMFLSSIDSLFAQSLCGSQ